MKKKFFRLACCFAATCGMFAFSGCAGILRSLLFDDSSSSEKSYAEDEWNPYEDALGGNSSSISSDAETNASSENTESSESGENSASSESSENSASIPQPNQPDSDKELLRTETDELGHKIAYYADGTKEDLGRVTPLDFTPVSPTEKEGYQYFATLKKADGLCAFYREIFTVACSFHGSNKNVTLTEDYYDIAEIRFSQHGLTSDEAVSVWRTVSLEYPEFFWWGNTVLLGKTQLNFLIDPLYAQASERAAAQMAIEDMVRDCDRYLDGTTSKVERALTLHDYVAQKIEYAYEADNVTPEDDIWAHNIAGGAQYGKGVCESYAKTYGYLCETFALPCITAAGFASENGESFGHAWNVVQIDGGWYNVDVTWDDLGKGSLSRQWFGTQPDVFAQTHDVFSPDDGWNVNYMFALPTLDGEGLTPIRAANAEDISSGKYTKDTAPMYKSIEDVCELIGEGITYETYLYPKTEATLTQTEIVAEGATLDTVTHTEGTLVINGTYRSSFGGYYELADLFSPNEITFSGDVVLRDVAYTVPKITLGGNTLTTEGTVVEITAKSGIVNGDFIDKTTKWTGVTAVALNTVTAQGTELRLMNGGTIDRANIASGVLRLNGAQAVTINTLWYATASEQLYIDGAASTTRITIGDITVGTTTAPDKVTIFVAYFTVNNYPIISVNKKTTDAKLSLHMYSDYTHIQTLGRPFIYLGESISLPNLRVVYSWFGSSVELAQSYYQKSENGAVGLK